MVAPVPHPVSCAAAFQLEGQIALWSRLSSKALESIEKIVALNTATMKAAFDENAMVGMRLLSARDPGELFLLALAQTRPNLEIALGFGRQFSRMASSMQAGLIETMQEHVVDTGRRMDDVVKGLTST